MTATKDETRTIIADLIPDTLENGHLIKEAGMVGAEDLTTDLHPVELGKTLDLIDVLKSLEKNLEYGLWESLRLLALALLMLR